MRGDRFVLKVALLAVGVALVSFGVAYQVLDDDNLDAPPRSAGGAAAVTTTTTTTAPASTTTTTAPGGSFPTPAWVAIVASEDTRGPADEAAAEIAALGYPAGVLRSDDYGSLKAGLWVGYAGPYDSRDAAEAALDRLDSDGVTGAYVRCIGSKDQCSAGGGRGDEADD